MLFITYSFIISKAHCQTNSNRNFKIITGYKSGNLNRDEMSEIVVENQKRYADFYGYEFEVFKKNLANNCLSDKRVKMECFPSWSKIVIINNWLNTCQKNGIKERWIVWLDDDVIITNPNYNLNYIVEKVKKNEKINIILTKDPLNWHQNSQDTSINAGVMLIKCSNISFEIMDHVWSLRNFAKKIGPHQEVRLGTCPPDTCLHEQEAFANLLKYNPHRLKHVTIVKPQDHNIGINGLMRKGFFFDLDKGKGVHYPDDHPAATWKPGNFCGQCSGLPLRGIDLERDDDTVYNPRLQCVKTLLKEAKKYKIEKEEL